MLVARLCVVLAILIWSGLSASAFVLIEVQTAQSVPGDETTVNIVLRTMGLPVSAIQNDLIFSPDSPIVPNAESDPDCEVNPAIDKANSAFAFRPPGCHGEDCFSVRALIISFFNFALIPDGSVLYRCRVRLAHSAASPIYPLWCDHAGASDPDGNELDSECCDGLIVSLPGAGAPTPTAPPVCLQLFPTRTPTRDLSQPWLRLRAEPGFIAATEGGTVQLRASLHGPHGESLDGIPVQFERSPDIGELRVLSSPTHSVMDTDGTRRSVAEAELLIARDSPAATVVVTASAAGTSGRAYIYVDAFEDNRREWPPARPGDSLGGSRVESAASADGCHITSTTDSRWGQLFLAVVLLRFWRRRLWPLASRSSDRTR